MTKLLSDFQRKTHHNQTTKKEKTGGLGNTPKTNKGMKENSFVLLFLRKCLDIFKARANHPPQKEVGPVLSVSPKTGTSQTKKKEKNNMGYRSRPHSKFVYLNDQELAQINKKMEVANAKNFSVYARKMLVDGLLINKQFTHLDEVMEHLSRIGNNVNQVAKKANETNSVTREDVMILKKNLDQLHKDINVAFLKIIKEDRRGN